MLKELLLSSPVIYKLGQAAIGRSKDLMNLSGEVGGMCKILDIGCAPASLLKNLPESVEYHGFDPSQPYIEQAREVYRGRRASFYCAGVDDFALGANLEGSCDLVIASGVLHHLDDAQAEKLLRLAHAALKSGGKLLTLDTCFIPRQNIIARFLAKSDRGKFVRYQAEYERLLKGIFHRNISIVIHSDGARLPYNHITMKAAK